MSEDESEAPAPRARASRARSSSRDARRVEETPSLVAAEVLPDDGGEAAPETPASVPGDGSSSSGRRPRRRWNRAHGRRAAPAGAGVSAPLEPQAEQLPAGDESPRPAEEREAVVGEPVGEGPKADAEPGGDTELAGPLTAAMQVAAPSPRGRKKAVASPVTVNVIVPRGLGRRVNAKLIQQVVERALEREGWQTPASLDVVIVSDEEIREINATRRGVDEATDVLSFPLLDLRPGQGLAQDFFVLPPETIAHLGDVVISFSRVESQADEAGHSRERELAYLTVHGVLHILGYDHDTEERRRHMRRREEEVLGELGLRRNGS